MSASTHEDLSREIEMESLASDWAANIDELEFNIEKGRRRYSIRVSGKKAMKQRKRKRHARKH